MNQKGAKTVVLKLNETIQTPKENINAWVAKAGLYTINCVHKFFKTTKSYPKYRKREQGYNILISKYCGKPIMCFLARTG